MPKLGAKGTGFPFPTGNRAVQGTHLEPVKLQSRRPLRLPKDLTTLTIGEQRYGPSLPKEPPNCNTIEVQRGALWLSYGRTSQSHRKKPQHSTINPLLNSESQRTELLLPARHSRIPVLFLSVMIASHASWVWPGLKYRCPPVCPADLPQLSRCAAAA